MSDTSKYLMREVASLACSIWHRSEEPYQSSQHTPLLPPQSFNYMTFPRGDTSNSTRKKSQGGCFWSCIPACRHLTVKISRTSWCAAMRFKFWDSIIFKEFLLDSSLSQLKFFVKIKWCELVCFRSTPLLQETQLSHFWVKSTVLNAES